MTKNPKQLLCNEAIEPTADVLQLALGDELFAVYLELENSLKNEFDLEPEWRYYKDGKAWLCKVIYKKKKKKTIFWLSLWEDLIKTGFYFTERNKMGIYELEVDKQIKDAFAEAKPIGKLIPLIIDIEQNTQLDDLKAIIIYKKGLK